MSTGCRLNGFYGRVINPGSVVNGLASTLWLDSDRFKEIGICHMSHGQIMGSCIVSESVLGMPASGAKGRLGCPA